jgi:hypothetical protein
MLSQEPIPVGTDPLLSQVEARLVARHSIPAPGTTATLIVIECHHASPTRSDDAA